MSATQYVAKNFVDVKNPIIKTLGGVFGGVFAGDNAVGGAIKGRTKGERRGASPRSDIVSEKLCDDIIQYLAPTLEQHKGCTLIDVHPGACLWSSKLHDYLKPQRHLLMEPEERYYEPFLKPLLDAPGSNYRWTTLTGAHPASYWDNYRKVMEDPKLLPPRPELPVGDPARRKLDPSVLVIGNLARRYHIRKMSNRTNYWNMVLLQMAYSGLTNDLFHRGGLVRMLWWMPESDKSSIFPSTEIWRQNYHAGMSVGADVTEVVGTQTQSAAARDTRNLMRLDTFEDMIGDRVQRSMAEKHMSPPPDRPFIGFERQDEQSSTVKLVSPFDIVSHTIDELSAEVDEAYELLTLMQNSPLKPSGRKRGHQVIDHKIYFPQAVIVAEKRTDKKLLGGGAPRVRIHLELELRTMRLEASLKALEERMLPQARHHDNSEENANAPAADSEPKRVDSANPDDVSALARLRDRIWTLDEEHMKEIEPRGHEFIWVMESMIDEQMALFSSPPLLQRERRAYEPLKAEASEFWPRTGLMLLDMVPTTRDISVPGLADVQECRKICHEILSKLFEKRRLKVPEALDRLGPNAAQDLLPMVPAITDARKGGRLNPKNLRVRMLNDEMIEGLVKAFVEWPFRPSTLELELSSVSEAGGGEEATGEEEDE